MWRFFLSAVALLASSAHAGRIDKIAYTLTPQMDGESLKAVSVCLAFQANHEGTANVNLPDEWGGGTRYYERLKNLHVQGAISFGRPKPAKVMIIARPNTTIRVCYQLDADPSVHDVPNHDNFTYPVVTSDWFYIAGPSAVATVEGREASAVEFSWKLPNGWQGATNLEYPLPHDADSGPDQAVFIAGKDVHVARFQTAHGDLRIAWRGQFTTFSSNEFNAAASKTIDAEQKFWNEGQPHFLVTIAPTVPGGPGDRSIRGTGLGDAFAMAGLPNSRIDDLKVILAHEYFHSWNPTRLGGFDDDEERAEYWFSEGFTDYYARKLAYESHTIDAPQFAAAWNDSLSAYAVSPYRTASNSIIVEKFWTDDQVQKLPYQRGAILAATLDSQWRGQGKSLDGFMRTLRRQVQADLAAHRGHVKLIDRLDRAAAAYGVSFGDTIERNMIGGEPLRLSQDSFGPDFKVVDEELPTFYLGYDRARTAATGIFAGVDPDGPAYKAGLRDGMKRVSFEGGDPNDSRVPLTWHVLDLEGKPAAFTYQPQGHEMIHRQKVISTSKGT